MTALLSVSQLEAGYGEALVLHGLSLTVEAREIVAVVGANGAGKTTLLSAIAGQVAPSAGSIAFDGRDILHVPAHERPRLGLMMVPEGGRLFPFMTVEENLELGAFCRHSSEDMARRMREVMEIFPILAERRSQFAGHLSGGERQMCAIARAMMARPRLLLLDEPSVGLSPMMVERVFETVAALVRREQLTVVLVEQNVSEALEVADRAYVLDHGRFVREGAAAALREDRAIQEAYMGL